MLEEDKYVAASEAFKLANFIGTVFNITSPVEAAGGEIGGWAASSAISLMGVVFGGGAILGASLGYNLGVLAAYASRQAG